MRWIEALKVWNKTKRDVNPDHVWCTPRKGTPEHAQVKEIMARAKPAAVEERNVARRSEAMEKLEKVAKAFALIRKAQAEKRAAAAAAAALPAAGGAGVAEPMERVRRVMTPEEEPKAALAPRKVRRALAKPTAVSEREVDKVRREALGGATEYTSETSGKEVKKPITDEELEKTISGVKSAIELIKTFNETGEVQKGLTEVLRNFLREARAGATYPSHPPPYTYKKPWSNAVKNYYFRDFAKDFKFKRPITDKLNILAELRNYANTLMM